jgi:hypothetical protein
MREYCIECNKKLPSIRKKNNTCYILGSSIEIIDVISTTCTYCGKKQKIGEIIVFQKTMQELEEYARKNLSGME